MNLVFFLLFTFIYISIYQPLSAADSEDSRAVAAALVKKFSYSDKSELESLSQYLTMKEAGYKKWYISNVGSLAEYNVELRIAKKEYEKGSFNFSKGTQLRYFFPFAAWSRILENGVLNQHQAGLRLTRGAKKPEWRAMLENRIIGSKLEATYNPNPDNPIHFIRPKYAILDVSDHPRYLGRSYNNGTAYGEIAFILKDSVKNRSTWSAGDSYEPYYTTAQHAPASHSFAYEMFNAKDPKPYYFEAQIWGELDLRDVEAIWIPEHFSEMKRKVIERSGLPVFTYAHAKNANPYFRDMPLIPSAEPIYKGDKKKMDLLNRVARSYWKSFVALSGYGKLLVASECSDLIVQKK